MPEISSMIPIYDSTYMPEGGWLIPVVNDNKQIII